VAWYGEPLVQEIAGARQSTGANLTGRSQRIQRSAQAAWKAIRYGRRVGFRAPQARPKQDAPEGGIVFKTIAWATDLSSSAHDALAVAKRLARDNAAKIVIVHVDERPVGRAVVAPGFNGASSATLRRLTGELHEEGIEAVVMSSSRTSGDVARTIVDLAQQAGADVLVAGNRRHGPLARLLVGDVASGLLRIAPFPVLIVPAGGKAAKSTDRGSAAATAA
jgi:nucleotide-binding universal stress UspA family protein